MAKTGGKNRYTPRKVGPSFRDAGNLGFAWLLEAGTTEQTLTAQSSPGSDRLPCGALENHLEVEGLTK